MTNLLYGCNCTDILTSGGYTYYLYIRIDNYALILRQNAAQTEFRFKIICGEEVIATVWAAATSQTYVLPSAFDNGTKKSIMNKYVDFISFNPNVIGSW